MTVIRVNRGLLLTTAGVASFLMLALIAVIEGLEVSFYILVGFCFLYLIYRIINRLDLLSPILTYTFTFWGILGLGSINFDFYPPIFFGIKEVPSYQWVYYFIAYTSVVVGYIYGRRAAQKKIFFWKCQSVSIWEGSGFWRTMNIFMLIGVFFCCTFFVLQGAIPILSSDPDSARRVIEWHGAGFIFFNTYFIDFVPIFVLIYWLSKRQTIDRRERIKCILYISAAISLRLLFAVRSQLVPFLITAMLAYHIYVKKLRATTVIALGICILLLFGFIGYFRDFRQSDALSNKVLTDGALANTVISTGLAIRQIPVSLTYILENVPGNFEYLGLHGLIRPFLNLLPGYGNVVVQEDAEFWGLDEQMGMTGTSIGQAYRIWGVWFVVALAALWGYFIVYFYMNVSANPEPARIVFYSLLFSIFISSVRSGMYIIWPEVLWKFLIVYGMNILIFKDRQRNIIHTATLVVMALCVGLGFVSILRNL